jgi:chitinase
MLLASLILLTTPMQTEPTPVVAGYLPAWRVDTFDLERLTGYTDVLYFSIQPTAQGTLDLEDIDIAHLPKLRLAKAQQGFRLLVSVGGWERSEGFAPTAGDPAKRQRFAQQALEFCQVYGFDGVDLDWEHPKNEAEGKAYGDLIQALKAEFAPKGLLVTAAIAGWQAMSDEAVAALDRVHLMAYDHEGQQATMQAAREDVRKLRAMGFPPHKIVLGVPFYGRHMEDRERTETFVQLLARYRMGPEVDVVEGYAFNGPRTMRAKGAYAKQEGLGGVMVWEVAQDTPEGLLLGELRRGLGLQ